MVDAPPLPSLDLKSFDPAQPQRSVRVFPREETTGGVFDQITLQFATVADEISPWGIAPRTRDRQLRAFSTTESWLCSTQYATCARNASYQWKLRGPPLSVNRVQRLLMSANMGAGNHASGWVGFVMQVSLDLLSQDNGAFIEVIRSGPKATDPVIGLAHLDAGHCMRTSDPEYPVIYTDRNGVLHKMGWWQIIPLVEMPSTIEELNGIGYCALTRVLRAAQILRDISVYESEKISGRFNKAIHLVSGPTTQQIKDALAVQANLNDDRGLIRYMEPLIIGSLDPTRPVAVATIEMASLPDGFDKEVLLKYYISLLALGHGMDHQDLAPLPGGNLGTSSQSETLARKSSGKGPALFQKIITHLMNWEGIIPQTVEFVFEEDDLEQEEQKARVRRIQAEAIERLTNSGVLSPAVSRQVLLEMGLLTDAHLAMFGEEDITPDVVAPEGRRPQQIEAIVPASAIVVQAPNPEPRTHNPQPATNGAKQAGDDAISPERLALEKRFEDAAYDGLQAVWTDVKRGIERLARRGN